MSILNEIETAINELHCLPFLRSVAVGFYKRIQALMSSGNQSPETPLLDQDQPPPEERADDAHDNDIGQKLQRLEMFLTLLGFNQSSTVSLVLSWIVFLTIGLVLPVTVLQLGHCEGCERYQNKSFELNIVVSQACLAGVSLLCVSHNLRKYGIREFLFVDQLSGRMGRLKALYMQQISNSVKILGLWSLICFGLKAVREIIRMLYVPHDQPWLSFVILLSMILSWTYLSTIFLAASSMFHLVCNLQVIHFEDYAKLLDEESEISFFIGEHTNLRRYLSKISHRFRIFLVLQFLVVTASQFTTLFQTTAYSGRITYINGGDFAVSAVVQVVGIILCLHAATKISHRAQAIASVASKWHAIMSCSSTDATQIRISPSGVHLEATTNPPVSFRISNSESDVESMDQYMRLPAGSNSNQFSSYMSMSAYHRRQAFVLYLQMNPGGITIFGWTVDRHLINTIFFIELSLVTFVLGRTVVFTSE
ncbi:Zinc finger CONSTANS-like protein [Hirschfeldia incana]|nr:Zinc finger CONSTANS-like protein [Hirschfeldia incana]